mgnify:CR=1 FL=1
MKSRKGTPQVIKCSFCARGQDEVAKLVARYDILAVPVVNDNNRLMGIVTVDDALDNLLLILPEVVKAETFFE